MEANDPNYKGNKFPVVLNFILISVGQQIEELAEFDAKSCTG